MKLKSLFKFALIFSFVLVSYNAVNAQIVDAAKDAAAKTKSVTIDTVNKTVEMTTDTADKTKDVTVDAAKKTASGAKTFGNYSVSITDTVTGAAYEGGKWFVTSTWDGAKWVSKRVWYPNKKETMP